MSPAQEAYEVEHEARVEEMADDPHEVSARLIELIEAAADAPAPLPVTYGNAVDLHGTSIITVLRGLMEYTGARRLMCADELVERISGAIQCKVSEEMEREQQAGTLAIDYWGLTA